MENMHINRIEHTNMCPGGGGGGPPPPGPSLGPLLGPPGPSPYTKRLGNYELFALIGEGSFGKVYRATPLIPIQPADNHSPNLATFRNHFVALKVIPKIHRSENELAALRLEADIQRNLNHPNIIQMLDSFETEDTLVLVTEYANGSLYGLLKQEGRLQMDRVQLIACHLVSALLYLHSRRILHRDIKPQNILNGADGHFKLCDFGFARSMDINTYLLTSMKGTPLYMAPEIIDRKPYDETTDLWSLGCILYELLVGKPPFCTTSVFQLTEKIKKDSIVWPDCQDNLDCLSFLKGLLEKDPQIRLSWPDLLDHPFVQAGIHRIPKDGLTRGLSKSQESAKEHQRQSLLEKRLNSYTRLLLRTAKKYEHTKKELKKRSNENSPFLPTLLTTGPGPASNPAGNGNGTFTESFKNLNHHPSRGHVNETSNVPPIDTLASAFENIRPNRDPSSGSSCESLTSSSSDSDSDGGQTVIMENGGRKKSVLESRLEDLRISQSGGNGIVPGLAQAAGGFEADPWDTGGILTLHSFGTEDKPIESDEWVDFLVKTMKEVNQAPGTLCEKHFLTMLVAPLRNHLASPVVVEKIATLLALPFTMDREQGPELLKELKSTYLDSKVVPNLLYACKLTVRRRKLEDQSLDLQHVVSILTGEDLDAMDKCLRLVCFLTLSEDDFVIQFCDSICVLRALGLLRLFLQLDKRKCFLSVHTMSILCHVMRTIPSNISILEDILLDDGAHETDLWRLMDHEDVQLQSCSFRVLGYLVVYSEKAKEKLIRNHNNFLKLWRLLGTESMHPEVNKAKDFALGNVRLLTTNLAEQLTSNISNSNEKSNASM